MHFIFTAIGSEGDINPMLAIACELADRGHDVEFLANAYFAEKVASRGLTFVPLGDVSDYERAVADPDMWVAKNGFSAVWSVLKDSFLPNYQLIDERLRSDTRLVGSTLAIGSRLVQEKKNVFMTTVHLSPSCIMSAHQPAKMPGLALPNWIPLPMKEFLIGSIDRHMLDPVCLNDLNSFRKNLGLDPVKSVVRTWINSPQQVICAFPEWFAALQPDWPANTQVVGFPIREMPVERLQLSDELEAFLNQGTPPVVFTAGSAMAHSSKFFQTAVESTELSDHRAIFVSQYENQLPKRLSKRFIHVPYAPFRALFPRCSVVVHHGGIGTSIEGLLAGTPQLVIPFAHDQFDNADRLERIGVASSSSRINARIWRRRLSDLRENPRYQQNCRRVRESMQVEFQSLSKIADLLEA
ncbi:MAG: glycosyltransferase [Cyanobacteria bacterium]|nr:glycosyltransferase [Cyanobacteriota bacterium]